jgi:hypothetical protein
MFCTISEEREREKKGENNLTAKRRKREQH